MTPAAYVYNVLASNLESLPQIEIENVYTFYVDDNASPAKPLIRITETVGMGDAYGNNEVLYNYKRVQLDIYYPRDYIQDMNALEQALKQVLRANGIYCYSDAGHVITLDSKNITNTLKFNLKLEVS